MTKTGILFGIMLSIAVLIVLPAYPACLLITRDGNIRSGPGTEYKIIGNAELYDVYEGHIDSAQPKWFKSETQDSVKYIYKKLGRVFEDCDAVRKKIAAFPNQPDGFRGIKWGTRVEDLEHLKLLEQTGDFEVYAKTDDNLNLGETDLEKIVYMFYKGRFAGLVIEYESAINYRIIDRALVEYYGPGQPQSNIQKKHQWDGFEVLIGHEFNSGKNKGRIIYAYKPVMEKSEKDLTQKARAAAKDF
jgi:hypothetical protein